MSGIDWSRFAVFADLAANEQTILAGVLEEQTLRAGEVLCLEGSESDGAILLLEGALDCASERAGDLGRVEAPAALGLAALARAGNREASLKAAAPSRVALLTRNAFHRFAQDAPSGAVRVLESVVRDLAAALHGSASALLPPRS